MSIYKTEGSYIGTEKNKYYLSSIENLRQAFELNIILEAKVEVCDAEHNLYVDLHCCRGKIPREEGAIGIKDGYTKDIALITRVNRPVCFKIVDFGLDKNGEPLCLLSRRLVQEMCQEKYLAKLGAGDIIPAKVTHLEQFGAFVDIGCGISSLLPIDAVSVSRISHPKDRFRIGQEINVIIKGKEGERFFLTHKELLGTWLENASKFSVGETITGIVRSVEEYGIFIEIAPNLVGLAEPYEDVEINQEVTVYIKTLNPDKMKVKLVIVGISDIVKYPPHLKYFYCSDHINNWNYSTPNCLKVIESDFSRES